MLIYRLKILQNPTFNRLLLKRWQNAAKEQEKFYDKETPELLVVQGNEFRFYTEGQRLAVSKPQWIDKNGNYQIGKTVSIDLASNKGNQKLIDLLASVIEMLKNE